MSKLTTFTRYKIIIIYTERGASAYVNCIPVRAVRVRTCEQQLHSVSKASIRSYCDESHDIASAKNMHTALEERRTSQGKGSVSAHMRIVQEQNSTLEMNKIANLNSLHNFEFTVELTSI